MAVNRFKKFGIGEKDDIFLNKNVNLGTIHFQTFTSFQNYNVLKCQPNHTPTFNPIFNPPESKTVELKSFYYDTIRFLRYHFVPPYRSESYNTILVRLTLLSKKVTPYDIKSRHKLCMSVCFRRKRYNFEYFSTSALSMFTRNYYHGAW